MIVKIYNKVVWSFRNFMARNNKPASIQEIKKRILNDYLLFEKSHLTSKQSELDIRELFIRTNGVWNDEFAQMIARKHPSKPIEWTGIFGHLDSRERSNAMSELNKNGFHIFTTKLPDSIGNEIIQFAKTTPVSYLDTSKKDDIVYSSNKVNFDENNIISPRYQFMQNEAIECKAIQQLVFDNTLLSMAQEYLGCQPVVDLIALWWSAPYAGVGKAEAAQMYHFDMDRVKFLKFFFYLTDVNSDTGPHCYVKSSHKKLPQSLLKDGRLEDSEVEQHYGKQNMLELCGEKFTIMVVDTRGLHKGKDLLKGNRLLFQIEFAVSLFGKNYPSIPKNKLDPKYQINIENNQYNYGQIFK